MTPLLKNEYAAQGFTINEATSGALVWIVPVELNKYYAADKNYIFEHGKKPDYIYIGGYCE